MTNHKNPAPLLPATQPGLWAVGLTAVYALMSILNLAVFMRLPESVPWRETLLPIFGIFLILCGLSASVLALIAIIRKHERSWLVWLSIVPGVMMLILLLGEFLLPH